MHWDLKSIVNGMFSWSRLISSQIDIAFAGQNKKKAFRRSSKLKRLFLLYPQFTYLIKIIKIKFTFGSLYVSKIWKMFFFMFIRSQNLNKFEKNSIEEYNHKNENSSVILRLVNSNSERISFHKHGNQQC